MEYFKLATYFKTNTGGTSEPRIQYCRTLEDLRGWADSMENQPGFLYNRVFLVKEIEGWKNDRPSWWDRFRVRCMSGYPAKSPC